MCRYASGEVQRSKATANRTLRPWTGRCGRLRRGVSLCYRLMARKLAARTIRLDESGGHLRYRVPGHEHRIKNHAGKRQRFGKLAVQQRFPQNLD